MRPSMFARLLLLIAFFLSGCSTLIYEIIWVKHLVYLFGVTYHAITTVVTVFMMGLALGALLSGRYIDRSRAPLKIYFILELLIGFFGLVFPLLLLAVTGIYHKVHDYLEVGFFAHTLIRFLLSCLLLLGPTVAMGATLPALARFFVTSRARIGFDVGKLYGFNTLGAAVGCGLTGFVLMVELGLSSTTRVAVALNVVAAVIALLLHRFAATPAAVHAVDAETREAEGSRASTKAKKTDPEPAALPAPPLPRRLMLVVFFLSGFTGIAYELLWTRIVALFHPNAHTHVFSLVLSLFLVGTGLGSALYGRLLLSRLNPLKLYAVLQLLVGMVAVACPLILVAWRESMGRQWYRAWDPAKLWMDLYISRPEIWIVVLAVAVPALFFGMMFPIGNRLYVQRLSLLGTGVGALYFFSTVGGIAGSFATGFLLMPLLGAKGTLLMMGALNMTLGTTLLVGKLKLSVPRRVAAGVVPVALIVGVAVWAALSMPNWVFLNIPTRYEVDFYEDGRSTTDGVISVDQNGKWTRMLFANGEFVSAGGFGIWLPITLHPDPKHVMILAFDTGATSAMACESKRVKSVEAVDISDVQPVIAAYFSRENKDVMSHPKFNMVSNDGRNHLLTRREPYDVIFNGVAAYSSYLELTTREFFQLCKSRLKNGGIYAHKLHPHMLTTKGYQRVLATFLEVFPQSSMWKSQVGSIIFLFGWKGQHYSDFKGFTRYAASDMTEPYQAAGLFLLDAAAMKKMAGKARMLVDDRPARLGETLTLIDTGSDFLTTSPINKPNADHQLAIGTTIFNHLQPPSHYFTGLTATDTKKILAERAEKLILLPRQEKPAPVTDRGPEGDGQATATTRSGSGKPSASPGSASNIKRGASAPAKAPPPRERRGFLLQVYDPLKLVARGIVKVTVNGAAGATKVVFPKDDGLRLHNDVSAGDDIYSSPVPDFAHTELSFVVNSGSSTWKVSGKLNPKEKNALLLIKLGRQGKAVTMSGQEAMQIYAPPPGPPPPPPPPPGAQER